MMGKNVALRAEVIELLDRTKRSEESYSDVIVRLAAAGPKRSSLLEMIRNIRVPPGDTSDLTARVREIRRHNNRSRLSLR